MITKSWVNCLHPVEIVLERLCSDDTSLLKADSSMLCLLSKLKSDNYSIAAQLHQRLLVLYVSRKRNDAATLTPVLHDPKFLQSNYFPEFSKVHVRRCAKKVFERLYNNKLSDSENEEINALTACEIAQTENEEASFLKEFMNAMDTSTAQVKSSTEDVNILDELKKL